MPWLRTHLKTLVRTAVWLLAVGGLAVWSLVRFWPDALPTATCGRAGVRQYSATVSTSYDWDPGALACFHRSALVCAGSVDVVDMGVDSGTDDVVVLHRSGAGCVARVAEQSYVLDRKSPITRFDCDRIEVAATGETVFCVGGKRFILESSPRDAAFPDTAVPATPSSATGAPAPSAT